jgi:SNF2 family DNA or RNA helicase
MFHDFSSTESADENSMPIPAELTPHKKRKRRVHEDKAAKATRMDDQRRVEDSQKAQTLVMKKLIKEGVSNKDPNHQAVSFEEPVIYLHPEIGGLVKAHQLSGLQFMWREIIQDKNRQGCLLAHTMGLGKTMQV